MRWSQTLENQALPYLCGFIGYFNGYVHIVCVPIKHGYVLVLIKLYITKEGVLQLGTGQQESDWAATKPEFSISLNNKRAWSFIVSTSPTKGASPSGSPLFCGPIALVSIILGTGL